MGRAVVVDRRLGRGHETRSHRAHITASITDARARASSLAEELLNGTRSAARLVTMIDGAFLSHAILWLIGAMAVCGVITSFGAMFAMGRSSYRKD